MTSDIVTKWTSTITFKHISFTGTQWCLEQLKQTISAEIPSPTCTVTSQKKQYQNHTNKAANYDT